MTNTSAKLRKWVTDIFSVLLLDQTLNTKMKGKITAEYVRRVKKLCRSKLNGGNFISINAWAVGVVRWSAGIVDWTVEELVSMDTKTKKLLAMNGCLHTRSNIARLHLPRKEGGEGWLVLRSVLRRSSNPCMTAWGIAQSGCCRWF